MCPSECKTTGKYSGYSGAFKCLMDGVGEVAFVKHTTVMENVNGSDASKYRYLCTDGTMKGTYYIFKTGADTRCSQILSSMNYMTYLVTQGYCPQ